MSISYRLSHLFAYSCSKYSLIIPFIFVWLVVMSLFHSNLYFLPFALVCLLFSCFLRWRLRYCFEFLLFNIGVYSYTFPLNSALVHPICFICCVFILINLKVFSTIPSMHWLFRSVSNFYIFVNFSDCLLLLISYFIQL